MDEKDSLTTLDGRADSTLCRAHTALNPVLQLVEPVNGNNFACVHTLHRGCVSVGRSHGHGTDRSSLVLRQHVHVGTLSVALDGRGRNQSCSLLRLNEQVGV